MKYKDYIGAWIVYGRHNKKEDCDCADCRAQRELETENPDLFTAADLTAAEERGRREIADIVINAVLDIETTPRENWPSARDLLAKITQDCGLQSEVFPLLNMCRAKEAGDEVG